jgi:Kef-type K+ transport system membrane component KefB
VILALAGSLSTSAFIFPVLKEKGWEENKVGEAATSILLLQDLAVAPLLVMMPFIVGQGLSDPNAIWTLTAKVGRGVGVGGGEAIGRSVCERAGGEGRHGPPLRGWSG